jgi:1,4-dihydroxy-2-naphthoate octaprenyltransferase
MAAVEKSVITCDLEGRIQTFNDAAERIFGYARGEVVGKKRVSLFSPGLVVLEHVPKWLAAAVKEGEHRGQTVFVRKDGSPFAADIRISATYKDKKHIGYCGVTVPRPDLDPRAVAPRISLATRVFRWLVVTRAPFLTATLVPVLIGAAYAARALPGPFPWLAFVLALAGALALHVSANTFNDYFDWTSGTDQENSDYFLPFSGGSRSIELGLVTLPALLRLAVASLLFAAACGVALVATAGPSILAYGAVGAFAAFFYTAPPLRLVARKGLGELFIGLCFGPLMTAGTFTALTGRVEPGAFLVGVPIGLLTTAILWINEFPDAPSDARTGKNHLVVVLGKRAARWGYASLLVGAGAVTLALAGAGVVPWLALCALAAAPLGVRATTVLFRHYADRALVAANRNTILLHLAFGLLFAFGLR